MAGQDSIEVSVQKKRENRTLEAVYPRPSAIPDRYFNERSLEAPAYLSRFNIHSQTSLETRK